MSSVLLNQSLDNVFLNNLQHLKKVEKITSCWHLGHSSVFLSDMFECLICASGNDYISTGTAAAPEHGFKVRLCIDWSWVNTCRSGPQCCFCQHPSQTKEPKEPPIQRAPLNPV